MRPIVSASNATKAVTFRLFIICVFPMLYTEFTRNPVSYNQVNLLQANNLISNTTDDCDYLKEAVQAWFKSATVVQASIEVINDASGQVLVQWAQLLPVRCDWQSENGVLTVCRSDSAVTEGPACAYWADTETVRTADATPEYFAEALGVRAGGLVEIVYQEMAPADFNDGATTAEFYVRAVFNESDTIALT
jgi:hypothetical protein